MNAILAHKQKEIKATFPELLAQGVTFNQILVESYKIETGADIFKTFKAWKAEGYKVKKGEKGFPVFSRPSKNIKEEQGKNTEGEKNYFFTAYLFNELQVEQI